MMKLAIVLALAVAVSAAGHSGCFLQEDFTCVKKDAVRCGSDWCVGQCAVEVKKSCDTKVWFKNVCEEEDVCKEIKTPCGHDGDAGDGLTCKFDEECVKDKKCKLIPAYKKGSYYGWNAKSMPGGYFEVCKDVFSCAAVDPWAMDASDIEVVCKKEYEIVDDMDCPTLFADEGLWGGIVISEDKFYKMNKGFSCGKKLVGKIVCIEAEAVIKKKECGGKMCDTGFECATREICSEVAVEKPVCAKEPVYTCLRSGSPTATLCGNNICSSGQRCEIVAKKVCPTVVATPGPTTITVPVTVPAPAVPATPTTITVPVTVPAPAVPTTPTTITVPVTVPVPGTPGTPAPGTPAPGTPAPGTPATPTPPAATPVIPAASVVSSSLADALGTVTITDAVENGDGTAYTTALSTKGDIFSDSRSYAFDNTALAYSDVNLPANSTQEAAADADATANP